MKLLCLFSPSLGFKSIFLSRSSFISLNSPLGSQSIKFRLPIRRLLLKFSQLLNFSFLLIFNSPSINIIILLLSDNFSLFLCLFFNILSYFILFLLLFSFSLFDNQDSVFIGLYNLLVYFILLYTFFLNITTLTSFCSSSYFYNSFLFCNRIWASLSLSSFCFSL